jgi:hypothetical protein
MVIATHTCDYLIVGGGIAGLTTALKILTRHPHAKVVVLEKYKRIGGRAMTYETDLSGIGHVRWENGAGRIHSSHTHLLSLIANYKLHTAPINPATQFLLEDGTVAKGPAFEDLLPSLLYPFKKLPADTLARHTLWELARTLYGRKRAMSFFIRFPYIAELYRLRADLALKAFTDEMGTRDGYFILKEGFSELIEKIVADIRRRGADVFAEHTLTDFKERADGKVRATVKCDETTKEFIAGKLVLALHVDALRLLKCMRSWAPLKYLGTAKLLRIYAVFPVDKSTGRSWFTDMPRTITASPLRHIIPIDPSRGIIMISYTDDTDTEPWFALADGKSPQLQGRIMEAVRALYGPAVPEPLFLKAHPWTTGTTYWKPGTYDAEAMSVAAHRFGRSVFVVGESISTRQAWIEGALESVDELMKVL